MHGMFDFADSALEGFALPRSRTLFTLAVVSALLGLLVLGLGDLPGLWLADLAARAADPADGAGLQPGAQAVVVFVHQMSFNLPAVAALAPLALYFGLRWGGSGVLLALIVGVALVVGVVLLVAFLARRPGADDESESGFRLGPEPDEFSGVRPFRDSEE